MEELHLLNHPMLALHDHNDSRVVNLNSSQTSERPTKLYLVPTSHGETYDADFAPNPTPLIDLPNIERWTLTYVVSVLEILAGRRSVQQLSRSTHRFTYNSLLRRIGSLREIPKIRKFHRKQPIEGVVEVVVTLVFSDRIRVLVARFEGVDRRWLCTEVEIL